MTLADDDIVLSYNGEIYNYEQLRADLKETGYEFTSDTDTEVILNGYYEWGLDTLLERVRGIFAFVIADHQTEDLHVVRDCFGVKPVYYFDGEFFACASEIKAILQRTSVDAVLNKSVLGEYLANLWVHEPDTLFKDIYKLESGHYLTHDLTTGDTETTEYWNILDATPDIATTDLDELIEQAMERNMVSDVPVGVYLSGGIDSSIITYHAAQSADDSLLALNLRNETDKEFDEFANLQRLGDRLNIDIESFDPTESMLDIYEEMIYYLDEPIADPAIIPAYLLAREANERGIKVMLSGMGADELWAGYTRYKIIQHQSLGRLGAPLFNGAYKAWPSRQSDFRQKLRRVGTYLSNPGPNSYFSLMYYFDSETVSRLLKSDSWREDYEAKIEAMLPTGSQLDRVQQFQYLDLKGFLGSHNLIYADKASMANGVEVRVPYLDRDLAEFAFHLPTDEKTRDGLKTPLKEHLRSILDGEFVKHDKQGFAFPIEDYLSSSRMHDQLETMVLDDRMSACFDIDVIKEQLEAHFAGEENYSMRIWVLYTFWLWLEEFNVSIPSKSESKAISQTS